MNAFRLSIPCLGLLFVLCCGTSATTGNQQLQSDKISQIQKGVTTRSQVETIFGPPMNVSLVADGRRMMMYEGQQQKTDMTATITHSMIPFAAFVPANDTTTMRRQMLQIYLSADNIVQDYEFSDNTSEIKTTSSAFGAHSEQTTIPNAPSDDSAK